MCRCTKDFLKIYIKNDKTFFSLFFEMAFNHPFFKVFPLISKSNENDCFWFILNPNKQKKKKNNLS